MLQRYVLKTVYVEIKFLLPFYFSCPVIEHFYKQEKIIIILCAYSSREYLFKQQ